MNLEFLSPDEREAWKTCREPRCGKGCDEYIGGFPQPTTCGLGRGHRGVCDPNDDREVSPSDLAAALTTIATLRHHLAEQQRAFVVGLDLAQRTADAEIAELRATLANDRGEGEPPSEGWTWNGACDAWYLCKGVIVAAVERWTPSKELPYWTMATDADYGREVRYQSARAAMKAADTAIKESP